MKEATDSTEKTEKRNVRPWVRVFWLLIILVVSALTVFLSFIWLGKRGVDSAKDAEVEIVTAFKPEEIVETFDEWRALEAEGNEGNILEVAIAEATEKFTRKTNLAMFGKTLPLGTTVSEISVLATYRYLFNLYEEWFLTSDGGRLLVLAPPSALRSSSSRVPAHSAPGPRESQLLALLYHVTPSS